MHTNAPTAIEIIISTLTIAGIAVGFYATLRSKLPTATIKIQNESIKALQEQNQLLKDNVAELNKILTELKARVGVLETIPLQSMTDTMFTIAHTLNELKDIGKNNQDLIKASLSTGQANITINK